MTVEEKNTLNSRGKEKKKRKQEEKKQENLVEKCFKQGFCK